ncbi:hypothetical protein [Streptomyces sp. NPDC020747]|uniref:hypothetical protein n=1 Tax=Streptomyces sp. NPDC020747 TaxID=3365086 RepID=UPI0037B1DDC9
MTTAIDWPVGTIARYLTVGGATVDLTSGEYPYDAGDGIVGSRNLTRGACTGCPTVEDFKHWRPVQRMTFVDDVRDPETANREALEWAQAHAERCRAMPKPVTD